MKTKTIEKELENAYRELFIKNGIHVDLFNFSHNKYYSDVAIKFKNGIVFGMRWYKLKSYVIYAMFLSKNVWNYDELEHAEDNNITNSEELPNKTELIKKGEIEDPTIQKVVNVLSKDYNDFLKTQGFIKRAISKIIKEQKT